ncbi:glycosyltransferase family 2 protein [Pontibacter sp. G13]|uniref:glycosyltransferase family 2 protein n=1 Tax=Pontibacter sp. G13 TaxID=3074898 RepID=UPI00288A28D3|nr:glycosyltransferase family 2 protein [Pontibacter sp. G13]WNJ19342.1 glycosyltransferase family 2 protein [Pontibacter sp. G13]
MPPVTVVILNWNGKHWLEQFLPSVMQSTYPDLHVLVMDNASTDDSVTFLQAEYPDVQVEVLPENYGFTGGNNRALPYIETPYFVLLNSDVEVTPGWLEPLVALAESDPKIASVQPKIKAHFDKALFEYAGACGGFMDSLSYPFCRGRMFDDLEADMGQYDTSMDIFWASGACCLLRTDVVQEIGLFEESFFAHMEEIDFCWRAKSFGYRVMVEPQSVVYHVGGGSLPKSNPKKTYLNIRNSLACMRKNLPDGQVFSKIFARLILDGVWAFKSLLRGDFGTIGAIIKAHWHFFGKLGFWAKRRKEIYGPKGPQPIQTGVYPGSVVWQYFGKGVKKWGDLMGQPTREAVKES